MKMKLRLESPDVKIYLVLLLVIGEIVYSCKQLLLLTEPLNGFTIVIFL